MLKGGRSSENSRDRSHCSGHPCVLLLWMSGSSQAGFHPLHTLWQLLSLSATGGFGPDHHFLGFSLHNKKNPDIVQYPKGKPSSSRGSSVYGVHPCKHLIAGKSLMFYFLVRLGTSEWNYLHKDDCHRFHDVKT